MARSQAENARSGKPNGTKKSVDGFNHMLNKADEASSKGDSESEDSAQEQAWERWR